jgi:hypothetical protein
MEAFEEETGIDFTYLIVLIDGNGGPPTPADAKKWGEEAGIVTPVLTDFAGAMVDLMPFEGEIPARCAITPDMELMACYTGEPEGDDPALEAIITHHAGSLDE